MAALVDVVAVMATEVVAAVSHPLISEWRPLGSECGAMLAVMTAISLSLSHRVLRFNMFSLLNYRR